MCMHGSTPMQKSSAFTSCRPLSGRSKAPDILDFKTQELVKICVQEYATSTFHIPNMCLLYHVLMLIGMLFSLYCFLCAKYFAMLGMSISIPAWSVLLTVLGALPTCPPMIRLLQILRPAQSFNRKIGLLLFLLPPPL